MIRRLLFWTLIIIFCWLVIQEFNEIKVVFSTLAQGDLGLILLAVGLVVVFTVMLGLSYKLSFAIADIHLKLTTIIPVDLASMFVGAITPGGATAGMAIFVDDAVRRGNSAARAAAGLVIQMIADFTSLTIVIGVGLVLMQISGKADIFTLLSVVIVLAITIFLLAVMLVGVWRPSLLQRIFRTFQRMANTLAAWFKQPEFLQEGWAEKNADEFIEAGVVMVHNPSKVLLITLLMLGINLVDIAILITIFSAFGYNMALGTAVAGFAMANLAAILSPAPQGVGVVEGALVYTFDSLGVPWEINLAASLAYRGLTFWLPMIVGVFMLRRVKTFQMDRKAAPSGESIPWLAFVIAALGGLNIFAAIFPPTNIEPGLIEIYSPFYMPLGFPLTEFISGVLLILLAWGLYRRKRLAWLVSLVLIIGVIIAHVFVGGAKDQQAILGAGIGLWLLFLTPNFTTLSDPKAVRNGLIGLAAGATLVLALFATGVLPLDVLYMIGLSALGYFLIMVLRPVQLRQPASAEERVRARQIIEAHARPPSASLALLDDRHYFFGSEESIIAYSLCGRTALTLGDPIGARGNASRVVAGFTELCRQNDWIPVFYQIPAEHHDFYRDNGYHSICLGDKAVIDLRDFTMDNQAKASYHEHYDHFIGQGYQLEYHPPPLSTEFLDSLRNSSHKWPEIAFSTDQFFTQSRCEDMFMENLPLAIVRDARGEICALATLILEVQHNEVSVGLLRYHPELSPGFMNFLFTALLISARDQGFAVFSLGLSAQSGGSKNLGETRIEQLFRQIFLRWNSSLNFKQLREFKAQFNPEWLPQYFILKSLLELPEVLISLKRANRGNRNKLGGKSHQRLLSPANNRVWMDNNGFNTERNRL